MCSSRLEMPICPFTDHEFYTLSLSAVGKVKIIMIIAAVFLFCFLYFHLVFPSNQAENLVWTYKLEN